MYALVWGIPVGVPALLMGTAVCFHGLKTYQIDRISALLHPSDWNAGAGYTLNYLRETVAGFQLIGESKSFHGAELPNLHIDYVITFCFAYYGILIGALLLVAVGFFLIKAFRNSLGLKNQLGSILGISCGIVFTSQCLIYALANFGLGFFTQTCMPFLSFGAASTITTYVLGGVLLSVYRNANTVSERRHLPAGTKAQKA